MKILTSQFRRRLARLRAAVFKGLRALGDGQAGLTAQHAVHCDLLDLPYVDAHRPKERR